MFADVDFPVRLPAFEGPLDLLLYLIRKDEIDIYDIPIETVTRQYLDILYAMEQMSLEVAGEFFVMAATLMEIKSRLLLPRHQQIEEEGEDDEPFDPRWELVHQLLEYQKFKQAAEEFKRLSEEESGRFSRVIPTGGRSLSKAIPLERSDRLNLWHALNQVLRRLSEKLVIGEITGEIVSVSDRMEYILDLTSRKDRFLFSSLFEDGNKLSVRMVVATFLALLELVRMKRLKVEQSDEFSDIACCSINELQT